MNQIGSDGSVKKKSKKRIIIITLSVFAILALFFALRPKKEQSENLIETDVLQKRTLVNSISATGVIEGAHIKNESSTLTGQIISSVKVKVGSKVEKGDVLCVFDLSSVQSQLDAVNKSISISKQQSDINTSSIKEQISQMKSANKAVEDAKASEVNAALSALNVAKSALELAHETGMGIDEAQAAADSAQTLYNAKSGELTALKNGNKKNLDALENSLKTAQLSAQGSLNTFNSQKAQYEKQLKNKNLTASISGTVTAVNKNSGDIYTGGTIVTIEDLSSFVIKSEIDEYDISDLKTGMKTLIKTDATKDEELLGEITFIAPSATQSALSASSAAQTVSASTSATYSIKIKMTSENDRIRSGMKARLSIILSSKKDIFAVPYNAISESENEGFLIYVKDTAEGEIRQISVTKGIESDYYVEISSADLYEGLLVVLPPANATNTIQELINQMKPSGGM